LASGVVTADAGLVGRIGRAILDGLLPSRRPRVSVRKVKSPLSRWNKADPHRPARSTPVTALTVTVSGPETTPQSATRRHQCLIATPGPYSNYPALGLVAISVRIIHDHAPGPASPRAPSASNLAIQQW
jgi:hypothetical protein